MKLRLLEIVESHAIREGTAPAVLAVGEDHRALTRASLIDRIGRTAASLRRNLPTGGVVTLCLPNRPEYVAAFLGVLAAGDELFPIAADAAGPERVTATRRAGAAAAIADATSAEALRPLFQRVIPLPELSESALLLLEPRHAASVGDGPALLLQSSGTTALPKIVRRDGPSLDAVTDNMVRACRFAESDRVLAAVPLCHSYGLEHGLLAPVAAGTRIHVCQNFDLANVLAALRNDGITVLPGVPFMFDALSAAADGPFPSLRRAYSAGGPLPQTTFEAFFRKFGIRLGQVYGATEIGSVTYNDPEEDGFDPASVGRPMNGVSIRILNPDDPRYECALTEPGLVAVRAPSMLSGCVDGESPTLIDGHYLTGDLGRLDAHGALTITGRLNLLIDIGGRKVNPAEVEAALREHPGIGQCVVVAMRLSDTVQRLKAVVVPIRPDMELSPEDLRRFARERLSRHKVPRVFEIRSGLPTSPAGKVLRRLVETG